MELCQNLGLNKDNYSVSIPLGATINMAGAAVTISIMTMATVHLLGIQVDFPTAVVLSILSAVGACGASGVAGGSLLLIPLACSLFGIGQDIAMQVVAVGLIIGVIQDSCETALNSSSDVADSRHPPSDMRVSKKGSEFFPGKDARLPVEETRRTSSTRRSSRALRILGPPRRSGRMVFSLSHIRKTYGAVAHAAAPFLAKGSSM